MNTNETMSVSILSGKGGCGKTNLALNLAWALQGMNYSNLIMDCDLGLANLDVLLGITPAHTLQDVLLADMELPSVVHHIENGPDILPAASGVPELVDMNEDMRDMLLRQLTPSLERYDFVFLDLGAGIHGTVRTFAGMTLARILVVTPEPTSLTDSYALMKVLSQMYNIRDFLVVVNQVETKQEETATFRRLHSACKRFLDFEPVLLGSIREDPHVPEAVLRQTPLLKLFPSCNASRDIVELAKRLTRFREVMADTLRRKSVLEHLPL